MRPRNLLVFLVLTPSFTGCIYDDYEDHFDRSEYRADAAEYRRSDDFGTREAESRNEPQREEEERNEHAGETRKENEHERDETRPDDLDRRIEELQRRIDEARKKHDGDK